MTILGTLDFDGYAEGAPVNDLTLPWFSFGSTAPVAAAAAAVHGDRGAQIGGVTTAVRFEWREAQSTDTRVISAYFRIVTAGGSATYFGSLLDTTTNRGDWRINTDLTVTMRDSFTATGGTSPEALQVGVTYRYEWRTSTTGQELRIYEGESTTPYITRTGTLTNNQHTYITTGLVASPAGWAIDIDTVRVADDWVGPFAPTPPEPTSRWFLITGPDARRELGAPVVVRAAGPAQTMLIGAAVGPQQSQYAAFEGDVGQLHVYRTFDTGFPATWQQGNASWHPDRVVSWHSIKPDVGQTANGTLDTALETWVGSIPTTHRCMLTFQHEPENPNKGINAATWRTASRRFYDIVKSIRPDILVGPIIMGWTLNPASGRNPDDWDPGADKVDFYGVDAYQTHLFPPSGSPTGWTAAPHPEMVTQVNRAAQRDRPAAVGETACGDYQGNFTMKRDWIKACVDLMAENDAIAFCYFNTLVNHDMSPNSLITDDPLTQAYYSDLLLNPPTIH